MIQKHFILLFKPMLITAALEYKLNNYNKKLTGFSNESVVLICEFYRIEMLSCPDTPSC